MLQGRHGRRHQGSSSRWAAPTSWIAAAAAACVAGAVVLSMAPASAAASTVPVQLTLSGVASSQNPTGGAQVGVHPGDTVVMTASAIPTAGAPAGLSTALSGLLSGGLQVQITSGRLPGISRYPYTLGKVAGCPGGHASLPLKSLAKGTYAFTYKVLSVSVLTGVFGAVTGCSATQVTPNQDQLGKLTANNVKVTDTAVYSGKIVVVANPPGGQIGVQLPKQSVSVKVGPISTSVNLPGATLGVSNPVPGLTSKLGGIVSSVVNRAAGGSNPAGGKSSLANVKYTPPALTVPQKVMPHAVNVGGAGGSGTGFAAPVPGSGGGANGGAVAAAVTSTAPNPNAASTQAAKPAGKSVDLSSRTQLGGQQLPALLAIAAILALSLVTATYSRLVLLRRKTTG